MESFLEIVHAHPVTMLRVLSLHISMLCCRIIIIVCWCTTVKAVIVLPSLVLQPMNVYVSACTCTCA